MGLVYADIELINGYDLEMARRHVIGEEEVKRIQVNALVDTGSVYLCINESIQEILQLPVMERLRSETADGRIEDSIWYRVWRFISRDIKLPAGRWYCPEVQSLYSVPFQWKT